MGNSLGADSVLWSETQQKLSLVALAVPRDETADEARRKEKGSGTLELAAAAEQAAAFGHVSIPCEI